MYDIVLHVFILQKKVGQLTTDQVTAFQKVMAAFGVLPTTDYAGKLSLKLIDQANPANLIVYLIPDDWALAVIDL